MTKTAWMFPGQGSQSPGMGRQLLEQFPRARHVLKLAEQFSGLPLDQYRHRGPDDALRRPSVAEPLITAISIGYVEVLKSMGLQPNFVAGYSAGEVAAFYAAGVLSLEDAVRIAVLRGQLFEKFCAPESRMVTISGVAFDVVEQVLATLTDQGHQVYTAAQNAARHATLVGSESAVLMAESRLLHLGGETSQVSVSGKWHSIHLAPASELLVKMLENFNFSAPIVPLLTSSSAEWRDEPGDLANDLALGVSRPVLWRQIIQQLADGGTRTFIECGAGRVLFGLMRWSSELLQDYQSICVEDRGGGLRPLKRLMQQPTSMEGNRE